MPYGHILDIPTNIETTTEDQDTIKWLERENAYLKSENAYLRGKIYAYENFLKDKGYIEKEELEDGD